MAGSFHGEFDPPTWWLYDVRDPMPLASVQSWSLLPLESGFVAPRDSYASVNTWLDFFSDRGDLLHTVALDSQSFTVSPNGVVIVRSLPGSNNSYQLTAEVYASASGSPVTFRIAEVVSGHPVSCAGVLDRAGRILALYDDGSYTKLVGRWFDSDGSALTEPFPTDLDARKAADMEFSPLVGRGVAVSLFGFTATGEGERPYVGVIGDTGHFEAAPPWLRSHTSRYTLVASGRAYAFIDEADGADRTAVHVFAANGEECETLTFSPAHQTTYVTSIGLDGTVAQEKTDGSAAIAWWPGLLQSR